MHIHRMPAVIYALDFSFFICMHACCVIFTHCLVKKKLGREMQQFKKMPIYKIMIFVKEFSLLAYLDV